MLDSRVLVRILLGLAVLFACNACGKKTSSGIGASPRAWKSTLPLQDALASGGCLSLPKLFAGIQDINPDRPEVVVPTFIQFEAALGARANFRRAVAYGQLQIARDTVGASQELPIVSQEGCEKVVQSVSDGTQKEFIVKKHEATALMAEAEDGERLEFTWLSPQSVESKHRYLAFDQPCGGDKPVLVTVTKVIDWSDAGAPAIVPVTGSPYSIAADFLTLAAEAVGDSIDSVYGTDAEGARVIDLAKVSAMTSKPPRAEIISCGNVAPAPTDPADPSVPPSPPVPVDPGPTDPEHPPHDGDGNGDGPLPIF